MLAEAQQQREKSPQNAVYDLDAMLWEIGYQVHKKNKVIRDEKWIADHSKEQLESVQRSLGVTKCAAWLLSRLKQRSDLYAELMKNE